MRSRVAENANVSAKRPFQELEHSMITTRLILGEILGLHHSKMLTECLKCANSRTKFHWQM